MLPVDIGISDKNIYVFVIIILAVFILFIYNTIEIRHLLKQRKIWERLGPNAGELTLDHIHGIPEPSNFVLGSILTDSPGKAKVQGIPAALDHLGAALDAPLRALCSLSYLSVLFGLLGTVLVLAITFWGVQDIRHINPGLLGHIYLVNSVAVFLALCFYGLYTHYRRSADRLLLAASRTLGRLQSEVPEGVDPQLVAALEGVGSKFSQWGEDIYARHRQESERLVQEMQGLGEAIRQMVQSMVAAQRTEMEGIIPLLRSQDEKIELLSQRLDERFQDLARPLLQALPILESWRQRTEELKQAVEDMRRADLEGKTAALAQAASALGTASSELPQAAREEFRGARKELAAGLGQALRQGLNDFLVPTLQALHARLAELEKLQQALGEAVNDLPSKAAMSLAETTRTVWQETMQPGLAFLAESLSTLREFQQALRHILDQLPQSVGQGVAAGCQPLLQMNGELASQLRGFVERTTPLTQLPDILAESVQESLRGAATSLSSAVSRALRQEWQQVWAPEAEIPHFLRSLLEEQQNQVKELDRLTGRLVSFMENQVNGIGERVAQSLRTLWAETGDGYLRDILGSLKGLEKAMANTRGPADGSSGWYW